MLYTTDLPEGTTLGQNDLLIGYEPAGLTVHPPPQMVEGGYIFFVWVSSVTKIFS